MTNGMKELTERELNRELLRFAVCQRIQCRGCGTILDVRRAVHVEVLEQLNPIGNDVICAACYDRKKPVFDKLAGENSMRTYVALDGRELFGRKKQRG